MRETTQPGSAPHPPRLRLWDSAPAADWQSQAYPIGNGMLGAMIFGGAPEERIQVNVDSLWTGDEQDVGAYQNLGEITIALSHGDVSGYRRQLDLETALHTVQYTADGVAYSREAFASNPHGVLAFRFEAGCAGGFTGDIAFADAHGAANAVTNTSIISAGTLENGLQYETQILLMASGGVVTVQGDRLHLDRVDSFTLLVGSGTSYVQDRRFGWRGRNPHGRVSGQLAAAEKLTFDELRAAHVEDYRRLFGRVALDLGLSPSEVADLTIEARLARYGKGLFDPELEALSFQYGRYLLISSSRPGGLPANLQGIWNDSNDPPWRCDYHSDINVQMNYWPSELTNLSECGQPFIDYVNSLREVRAEATRAHFGETVRGWTICCENNACGGSGWLWNVPGSSWYCQQLWQRYAFTQDRAYLRDAGYPIMKEVCQFWQDHLITDPDGFLVTPDGWSPEQGPVEPAVTYDQVVVWDLFTNTILAAKALGVDDDFRSDLEDMRGQLKLPGIGKYGQLMEWAEDREDPEIHHRHVSHLYGLYPGSQISPITTPETAKAAEIALKRRGDESTGWAIAWRQNLWARLRDGDHAYRLFRNYLTLTTDTSIRYDAGGGVYKNLLCACPPFQIDGNFGSTAGVAEMLLQSHETYADPSAPEGIRPIIDLLPAIPASWPDGEACGLCARGAFTVDIVWSQGRLADVTVRSTGGSECRLRYDGQVVALTLMPGEHRTIRLGDFTQA